MLCIAASDIRSDSVTSYKNASRIEISGVIFVYLVVLLEARPLKCLGTWSLKI